MFSIQNSISQTRKLKLPEIPEVADGFFLQSEKQRTLQNPRTFIWLTKKQQSLTKFILFNQSQVLIKLLMYYVSKKIGLNKLRCLSFYRKNAAL